MTLRRQVARLGLVATQWLLLTATLGATIAHASPAVAGLLAPRIDGSWPFVVAFAAALLLGVTVRPYPALLLLTALMLVGAAGMFALLLVTPAIDGTVVWSTGLRTYALDQVVVLPLVLALPALFGAMLGSLARGLLGERDQLLMPTMTSEPAEPKRVAWWDARRGE